MVGQWWVNGKIWPGFLPLQCPESGLVEHAQPEAPNLILLSVVMADSCRVKDHQSHGDHVEVQTLHSSFLWFKLVFLKTRFLWQKYASPDGRKAACCGDAADAFARFQRCGHQQPGHTGGPVKLKSENIPWLFLMSIVVAICVEHTYTIIPLQDSTSIYVQVSICKDIETHSKSAHRLDCII